VIYRLISQSFVGIPDETGETLIHVPTGPLAGPVRSGAPVDALHGLRMPRLRNRRARFWFTAAGWRRFGLPLVAAHEAAGLRARVLRRKKPRDSEVAYRDRWQVALLPPSRARHSDRGQLGRRALG
jgi:hypothetical protein